MAYFDDLDKYQAEESVKHSEDDGHNSIWKQLWDPKVEKFSHASGMQYKEAQERNTQRNREGRQPDLIDKTRNWLDNYKPNESFNNETRAYMAPRFNTQGKSPSFMPQDENSPAVLGRRVSADYEGMENSPEIMEKNQAQQGLIP